MHPQTMLPTSATWSMGSSSRRRIEEVALTRCMATIGNAARSRAAPGRQALARSVASVHAATAGVTSELGMRATYQLVWTASQQRDLTSALAHAERSRVHRARSPANVPKGAGPQRWSRSSWARPEQARAAFDGWLRQFGADPELEKLVLDVQTRRAKL